MTSHSFKWKFEFVWGYFSFSSFICLCKYFSINCLSKSLVPIFFRVTRLFVLIKRHTSHSGMLTFCHMDCRCFPYFPFGFQYCFRCLPQCKASFLKTWNQFPVLRVSFKSCPKWSSRPSDQRHTPVFPPAVLHFQVNSWVAFNYLIHLELIPRVVCSDDLPLVLPNHVADCECCFLKKNGRGSTGLPLFLRPRGVWEEVSSLKR